MKLNITPQTVLQSLKLLGGALLSIDTPATSPSLHVDASNAHPVCIIGAGPSGLTVAHELEAKNYSTVIFEKHHIVGGKCQAHYDTDAGDTYHPLGALLFTNETYIHTLPIIEASGSPLIPGISPLIWDRFLYGPGEAASTVVPQPVPNRMEYAAILTEVVSYSIYWNDEFRKKHFTAVRYVNGIPDEWTVPMATFLESQGYKYLQRIMDSGMVPYGYGDIKETPAIYMLQYFTPDILAFFLGITPSHIVDFHDVFKFHATQIKGPIHLNTSVVQIDRTDASAPVVHYHSTSSASSHSSPSTQKCSAVVLAFPPTLPALKALNMPLTSAEHKLFSKVRTTPYWSAAVAVNTPYLHTFQQTPFTPLGEPVAFLRLHEASRVATAWQWGEISNATEARRLLTTTLTAVQEGAGIDDSEVTDEDVRDLRTWDYFPHFSAEDLAKGGVYEAFNALQGESGTYYSSGLNGFETVEFAVRAGKDLVNSFFD